MSLSLLFEDNTTKNIIVKNPKICFTNILLRNTSCNLHGNISAKKLADTIKININIENKFVSIKVFLISILYLK